MASYSGGLSPISLCCPVINLSNFIFRSYRLPNLACVILGGGTIVSDATDAADSLDVEERVPARSSAEGDVLTGPDEPEVCGRGLGEGRGGMTVWPRRLTEHLQERTWVGRVAESRVWEYRGREVYSELQRHCKYRQGDKHNDINNENPPRGCELVSVLRCQTTSSCLSWDRCVDRLPFPL